MKINFTLRIDSEVRKTLEELAKEDSRTLTSLINKILIEYIKSNKKKLDL